MRSGLWMTGLIALSGATILSCDGPTVATGEGADASECVDGLDNDADGLFDCDDDGCAVWSTCGGGDTSGDTGEPIDTGDPVITGDLCINEFMASNTNTVPDESGAYPDWVELYNLSDEDIPLDGFYITDDFEETDKEELNDLVLPASGFLLLWADGDVDQGDNHLTFKLSKGGEQLAVYDPNGNALNKITYDAQASDVSAARMPDGGDWEYDSSASPGVSNETELAD